MRRGLALEGITDQRDGQDVSPEGRMSGWQLLFAVLKTCDEER